MTTVPNFSINGVALPSPTEPMWQFPEVLGIDGRGVERLNSFYSFDLNWNAVSNEDYQTLYRVWAGQYNSGTSTIYLPKLVNSQYEFTIHTGVLIDAPKINGSYNQNYYTNIKMKVRKISV